MPVTLGARPQADFSRPLDLMSDCHRRIEHFLAVLMRVVQTSADGSLDAQQRLGLEIALRYFEEAAPRHTADEETSLFPRLRQVQDPAAQAALDAIRRLESDHRTAEQAQAQVDRLGRQWLDQGHLPAAQHQELLRLLQQLQSIYQAHIHVEDHELFPLAGRLLSPEKLTAIAQEMAQRRGL